MFPAISWLGFLDTLNESQWNLLRSALRALVIFCLGYPLLKYLTWHLKKVSTKKLTPQGRLVVSKIVNYLGMLLILTMVLNELGFSMKALLGSVAVTGVALAFASQNIVANFIAGVFLIFERPFNVGDVIKIGGVTGKVVSIDLLALKLQSFDNQYVRIPNSKIATNDVANYTQYENLRLELMINVPRKESDGAADIKNILLSLVEENDGFLKEPEPFLIATKTSSAGVDYRFTAWAKRENFNDVRSTFAVDVYNRLKEAGIESTCTVNTALEV